MVCEGGRRSRRRVFAQSGGLQRVTSLRTEMDHSRQLLFILFFSGVAGWVELLKAPSTTTTTNHHPLGLSRAPLMWTIPGSRATGQITPGFSERRKQAEVAGSLIIIDSVTRRSARVRRLNDLSLNENHLAMATKGSGGGQ